MDSLDNQLIATLRHNARLSVADLAHKLKVSRGTITNRIKKLEDQGIILGYTVVLRPDAKAHSIRAWTSIAIEGNATRSVVNSLLGDPAVVALHDTNGRWDLLAEIEVNNLAELTKALERLRLIKNISSTETSIHLDSYK